MKRPTTQTPVSRFDLPIDIVTDDNATVAVAHVETVGAKHYFTASAKREPGDVRDPQIAEHLSVARALRKVADALETAANEHIAELYGSNDN